MAQLHRGKVITALGPVGGLRYVALPKLEKLEQMHLIHLMLAIVFEVIATSLLKQADGFTRLWPTLGTIVCYVGTFYFLGLALKVIPIGIAYAVWCGFGIVLIAGIGYVVFGQKLDFWALLGLAMILIGVLVINTLSTSIPR
jgi:small multidrug resistance pump